MARNSEKEAEVVPIEHRARSITAHAEMHS